MTDILDNANVISQKDPADALGIIAAQFAQAEYDAQVQHAEFDNRQITNVVITGMGGSALAALMVKVLLQSELRLTFEVVRGYDLPNYVSQSTLVIASSYSGNTEETLTALADAQKRGAQIGIIASGGQLLEIADRDEIASVVLPSGAQPRMAMIYNLRALFALLSNFGIVSKKWLAELEDISEWLGRESSQWVPGVPTVDNYAKQLALTAIGKSPVFYGSPLTGPLAYKWKISWNETAKNTAFWNEYPEFNHNEFMGWTSHPVEKPFAVFDFKSSFDRPRITQRFEITDRLLSGQRPRAITIELKGESPLAQLLWGAVLADFSSAYAAILNGVDPTPVSLIEKLKGELADNPR